MTDKNPEPINPLACDFILSWISPVDSTGSKITVTLSSADLKMTKKDYVTRVQTKDSIRWYYEGILSAVVTTDRYYRDGPVHPIGCECDALVHDPAFDPLALGKFLHERKQSV